MASAQPPLTSWWSKLLLSVTARVAVSQGRLVGQVAHGADVEGAERWLRSPAEAAALFADLPEALASASDIAARCRLDLAAGAERRHLLDVGVMGIQPGGLRRICQDELARKRSEGRATGPEYDARLEEELAVFDSLGFTGFMFVVSEILAHCREEGIPVAVRGSAVSSLVLHLLGGSPVDPLAHGLLFERFLHAGKSVWPDVDIDLPWHRRDEVIRWVYQRFGENRVAMVSALHTLQEAMALIRRLVGRPRHLAVHPGGIVIECHPLADLIPLERAPKGVVTTQYDLLSVAKVGLVKLGLLGNRCLSEIEETLALSGWLNPSALDAIPAEDPETLDLIDRADTIGCFQLESPAIRSLLARLPIRRQSDLVAALALIRPGASAGEVKDLHPARAWRGAGAPRSRWVPLLSWYLRVHGVVSAVHPAAAIGGAGKANTRFAPTNGGMPWQQGAWRTVAAQTGRILQDSPLRLAAGRMAQ